MSNEDKKLQLEEYKELGNEYRYREQMMVQEFGFAMITIGVVINKLLGVNDITLWYLIVQTIAGFFIVILAFHLTHINKDRRVILVHREKLRESLGFEKFHLGAGGRRLSAPRTMIWFSYVLVVAWIIWIMFSISKILCC